MTLGLWIKSHIQVDDCPQRQHFRPRHSFHFNKTCKRFIQPKQHGKTALIFDKRPRIKPRLYFSFANLNNSDKQEDNTCDDVTFDSDSFIIGIDNHSSRVMSNDRRHFKGPIRKLSKQFVITPAGNLAIKGEGIVEWPITDDDGRVHKLRFHAQYVPGLPICLLPPQCWSQQAKDNFPTANGTLAIDTADACILYWKQRRYKKTVPWNPNGMNVARFRSASGTMQYRVFAATLDTELHTKDTEHVCFETHVIPDDDLPPPDPPPDPSTPLLFRPSRPLHSLSGLQEENLPDVTTVDTETFKHIIPDTESVTAEDPQAELLRWHYRLGHASFKLIKLLSALKIIPGRSLANAKIPKCAGCIYGAMTKQPWRTKPSKQRKSEIYTVTRPGQCVSVDQLESQTPGLIPQLKGKLTRQRYKAATVFVDHFSRLSYIHLQRSTSSNETLQAKKAFEAYSRRHGVRIQHYHADNGRFADNAFINHVKEQGQTISYCGVNAHFQNGIAEKRIRDLQETTRKELLHAKHRWPEAIELSLWPSALRNANHLRNTLPDKEDASSPLERFTGIRVAPKIRDNHAFGCPAYALDSNLASGKSIPKWNTRARLGINLGPSETHASSVNLVLSLTTGCVSPQFHAQFDDFFETVRPSAGNPKTFSQWQRISGLHHHPGRIIRRSIENEGVNRQRTQTATQPMLPQRDDQLHSQETQHQPAAEQDEVLVEDEQLVQTDDNLPDLETLPTTRSGRISRPTQRFRESMEQREQGIVSYAVYDFDEAHDIEYKLQEAMQHPISFLSTTNKDTMYYDQAIREPDAIEFVKAIVKEVNDHIKMKHWELIPRNEVPENETVLPSVWSMKRKRDIKTQQVYKHKARLNVHGGKQEFGVNYFETFAPVVTWFTIRLILVLALICGWKTRQIDFVLAYPQADIEFDMYMELPKGIETKYGNGKTHVLKLKKNLYGQKQAGRVWSEHRDKGLRKVGFNQSAIDECLSFRRRVLFAVFVDDGILCAPTDPEINEAINDLQQEGYEIDDQGELADYLGVNIERTNDGKFVLTQPHLIQQILEGVNLSTNSPIKSTPALSTKILHRDPDDQVFDGRFHYRSIIGKLNFLAKSTRLDIEYATHQCARHCSDPRQEHGDAIIHLAKYLKGTASKGIILQPDPSKSLEVWADADFCGNWFPKTAQKDPSTSKSRTGYVITYAGCPIAWSSTLQTLATLSSTEAEYVALSTALRHAIPLMELLKELQRNGFDIFTDVPRIFCKAFEDNAGALEMARLPKMRPRTRHINQVYHHFRDWVRRRALTLYPVDTLEQLADILTKPLPLNLLIKFREKLLGW